MCPSAQRVLLGNPGMISPSMSRVALLQCFSDSRLFRSTSPDEGPQLNTWCGAGLGLVRELFRNGAPELLYLPVGGMAIRHHGFMADPVSRSKCPYPDR